MSEIHRNVSVEFPDYLQDESRQVGRAESISFPSSRGEVEDNLREMGAARRPVTTQGARTGITGGAVPDGGHILNLSRMKKVLAFKNSEPASITVQSGLSLAELREVVREEGRGQWFFPPDPTETSASLGGMIACNASGARTLRYGPTRPYVVRLRVMLPDGSAVELARGQQKCRGRVFRLLTEGGRVLAGEIPSYRSPRVKSAAGYYVEPDMDLLDIFIGAEGTLGVITDAELRLVTAPSVVVAVLICLLSDEDALRLVPPLRTSNPAALEYFDSHSLRLLRAQGEVHGVRLPESCRSALYLEYHAVNEQESEDQLTHLAELSDETGCPLDDAVVATDEGQLQRLKEFRHAVPEAVNRLVGERKRKAPGITKLGTDLAVPDRFLPDFMSLYREGLERLGLEYVIFGHIGNSHLHVNIIPRDQHEYERGRLLYGEWAREAVRLGGTVAAEHGIGKLKRDLLLEMYGPEAIKEMRNLKKCFDPDWLLNPGTLFWPASETGV